MLNKTIISGNKTTNTTNISMNPACVGTLQKTHIRSKFRRFEIGSETSERVFSEVPFIGYEERRVGSGEWGFKETIKKEIIILQIMVFGDNQVLIEYVDKKDWED